MCWRQSISNSCTKNPESALLAAAADNRPVACFRECFCLQHHALPADECSMHQHHWPAFCRPKHVMGACRVPCHMLQEALVAGANCKHTTQVNTTAAVASSYATLLSALCASMPALNSTHGNTILSQNLRCLCVYTPQGFRPDLCN